MKHILHTGQLYCYDSSGQKIPCPGSGQDGEIRAGIPWPEIRFQEHGETMSDQLTGLIWTRDANVGVFPCSWQDAFAQIAELNRDSYGGFSDWRLPNRSELRSLFSYQTKKPALPRPLPADNIFLGWYWSSTTASIHPAYAWSIHMEGARMFYGRKEQEQLFWPVRGAENSLLPRTGQRRCYSSSGNTIDCAGSLQDGDLRRGVPWPEPRFSRKESCIHDRLTGLGWSSRGDLCQHPVNWQQALDLIRELNRSNREGINCWRLPNINELASLVDCSTHSPALPSGHSFTGLQDGYWSSTTSFFETDWAWVLYLDKGACGVGHKPGRTFFVWPVTTLTSR